LPLRWYAGAARDDKNSMEDNDMRTSTLASIMVGLVLAGCTAEVEERGSLPDVDVQGGSLPRVDVDPADVRITTDTQVVRVPQIEVEPTRP
jgi:hypothetical protein